MKRWLVGILCLMLLLSACNTVPPEETSDQTQPSQTEADLPVGKMQATGSAIEKNSADAVRTYAPKAGNVLWVGFMDTYTVMISSDGETVTATRFDPETGDIWAEDICKGLTAEHLGSIGLTNNRFAYYDGESGCYRILDSELREVDTAEVTAGIAGTPLLSSDLTTAYFCVGSEVWCTDIQSGVSRLILRLNDAQIRIEKLLLQDTVLACRVEETDGDTYVEFFSASTGESLGNDGGLISIDSWNDAYLIRRMDGSVMEILVGGSEKPLQSIALDEAPEMLTLLPGMQAAAKANTAEDGLILDILDLTDGSKIASLKLTNLDCVDWIKDTPGGNHIWFVAKDPDTQTDLLCCWDLTKASGGDETVRLGVRYTAQNPDTEGLGQCRGLAKDLSKKYSVDIRLYTDPAAPEGYSYVPEYQVEALRKALQTLDEAMGKFPEGFFKTAAKVTEDRVLHISLVRELTSKRVNPRDISGGLQYWDSGNAYIALVVGDAMEQSFYNGLSHALDTYVYSYSIHYDFWNDCNPKGFQYDENYGLYGIHSDSKWLEDENRAFVDAYSMTFPYEDRAAIFTCAIMEGNADVFGTDVMQAKLKQLCMGLREAFGWEKSKDTFPWEQYLKESLAYTKKK